jgi:hypothetical protein
MKIAFVADVHLGNHKVYGGPLVAGLNDRCRMVLGCLRSAYDFAMKEDCQALIVDGDLFDTAKPPPQLIAAVQAVIDHYPDVPTYIMLGNHDMESAAEGDHALGPLSPVATIITKPTKLRIRSKGRTTVDEVEVWAVPFQPGKAEEWLPLVLAEVQGQPPVVSSASSPKVLALHLGLRDKGKTPPWLMDAHDSVGIEQVQGLVQKHELDAVYAGNWHNPEEWVWYDANRSATTPLRAVQIGTLCPTGFDNPGASFGTMAIYDSHKNNGCCVLPVPGPRFFKVDDLAELNKLVLAAPGQLAFVRATVEPAEVASAERLVAHAVAVGHLGGGEVEAEATEAQVALRQAVGVARSAETVDEAVAGFVAQMPLKDPALRAEVLERVKGFLGGST